MVADAESLAPVPKDGATMGEVFMRGNIVMKGYLKNPSATNEAFAGGWFHTGDLGVCTPGATSSSRTAPKTSSFGRRDISSIEVEGVLYRHPAVAAAAVVAKEDERWARLPALSSS